MRVISSKLGTESAWSGNHHSLQQAPYQSSYLLSHRYLKGLLGLMPRRQLVNSQGTSYGLQCQRTCWVRNRVGHSHPNFSDQAPLPVYTSVFPVSSLRPEVLFGSRPQPDIQQMFNDSMRKADSINCQYSSSYFIWDHSKGDC